MGRTKDTFLNACLHAMLLQKARYNIDLHVVHIAEKENTVADTLSRGTFKSNTHEYWEASMCDVCNLSL